MSHLCNLQPSLDFTRILFLSLLPSVAEELRKLLSFELGLLGTEVHLHEGGLDVVLVARRDDELLRLRGPVVAADALGEGPGEQVLVEADLDLLLGLLGGGDGELEDADPDGGEDPHAGGGQLLGVVEHPVGDLGGEDGLVLRAMGVIVGHVVVHGGVGLHQQQSVGSLEGGYLVLGELLDDGLGRLAGRAGHEVLGRHDPSRVVRHRQQGHFGRG